LVDGTETEHVVVLVSGLGYSTLKVLILLNCALSFLHQFVRFGFFTFDTFGLSCLFLLGGVLPLEEVIK